MKSPLRLALLPSFVLLAACPPPPDGADAGPDASTLQAPELTSVFPTRGPVAGGTSITVNGANFEEGAQVLFGDSAATQVVLVNKRKLTVRSPAAAAIGPVNVSVVNPDGQGALLPNGFLYETAAAKVIDEAMVLNELATDDATGANPVMVTVLADVSVPTVTSAAGQGAGVKAQVGWTEILGSTPQASSWTWADAAYTADADGPGLGDLARDRYAGTLPLPGATGTEAKVYSLAARFSLDDGATWTFADRDGASNGVTTAQVPKVTVSRPLVDWCKLGGELVGAPPDVKLKVGQPGIEVFGQVYRASLTNQGGAGAGITGQVGYGAPGSDPATWIWVAAAYGRDTGGGANDEYQATLPNPGAGTFAFAFRFALAGGPYRTCDADGSSAPGFTADQAGALTVTPVGVDHCNLQFPSAIETRTGLPSSYVYGRVWAATVTDGSGAGAGITGELGFGPPGVAPTDAAWTWSAAGFNTDADTGSADEYRATLPGPSPGNYEYAFRFSYQGGAGVYCDLDGSENGYQSAQGGALQAKALGVDACTFQGPATVSATPGATTALYTGRVIAVGISDQTGAGAGITAEVGYGPAGSTPSAAWTWTAAGYHSDQDTGASDQYQQALTAPAAQGVYDVAYRFNYGTAAFTYCDLDGSANGYQPAQASKLSVSSTQITSCKLQWVNPSSVASGGKVIAFGRVLVPGVTAGAGQGAGVRGQAGVGNGDARSTGLWAWKEAAYYGDPAGALTQDEYSLEVQPAYTGAREVSFRFSVDDGVTWTYCDQDGTAGVYDPARQWGITVTAHTGFGWCNVQWPPALGQGSDGGVNVYGRAFKTGVTPDAGAAISAWLGFGQKTEDPGLSWTWLPAAFQGLPSDSSNEYVAPFPALDAGSYSYAYRFQNGAEPSYCYGDLDSSAGGFNGDHADGGSNLGTATVTP